MLVVDTAAGRELEIYTKVGSPSNMSLYVTEPRNTSYTHTKVGSPRAADGVQPGVVLQEGEATGHNAEDVHWRSTHGQCCRSCASLSLGASEPGPHFVEHLVCATAANGRAAGIEDFSFLFL